RNVRWRRINQRPANLTEIALPHSGLRDEKFPDRGVESLAADRDDEDRERKQNQGGRRERNQSRSDRASGRHSGRSAQVSARFKGNGRSFASLLHGGRTRRWDGDTTPIQRGTRARQDADSHHGQSESGRERRVRSALPKISAQPGDDHDKRRQRT